MSATKTSELLVVTVNGPGVLARLTAPLAANNINVDSFCGYEWGKESAIRLVTSNNKKARELLSKAGYNVSESTVVLWSVPNKPGLLRKAASALAEQGVNIFCTYATGEPGKTCNVSFATSNPDKAVATLEQL